MTIVDLSMTIQSMWRWPHGLKIETDFKRGDPFRISSMRLGMHAFTHVDTPLHIEPLRETIDQVDLSHLCGAAAVLDLTPIAPEREIGPDILRERGRHVRDGDIVLMKTGWDGIEDYYSREYWTRSPYLNPSAAEWLAGLPIKAVGFDFPQDHAIREIPARVPLSTELPTHDMILRKGIYLIEYLCNLNRITSERVDIFALPLKIAGAEAACARVVAVMK